MNYFPTNLRHLRAEHNLSQQEIANVLGIKQNTYSNYERGNTDPSLDLLLKISRLFRTSLDMLVGFALFDNQDRAVADSLNISNTELVKRAVKQGLNKDPNYRDEELVSEYKKSKE
jgi:transcriptional regulator with XRE-family HTH domain